MITFKTGSIFDSECETLVCPVNCVGVLGKGLALEFKRRFPGLLGTYQRNCERGILSIGRLTASKQDSRFIICFPTKDHWRNKSQLSFIDSGLEFLVERWMDLPHDAVTSIAIPALGCGCGELRWEDVKPLMVEKLSNLPINIEIYEPY